MSISISGAEGPTESNIECNLFVLASLIEVPTYYTAKSLEIMPLIPVVIGQSPGLEECYDHTDISGHF